ncbi:MAG TPA: PorP/SprF family type IX secretion system membrane protein [Chitinophagaceae bacterium]|nr:PorP/SprF family type IX secretion system membrane protein [Chitinophagaceae bacterium]
MKKLVLLLLISSVLQTQAQDPNFSQFFVSPLSLNPALTGKFNGTLRVAGNYRNQWPAFTRAFITSTLSVDAPILTNRLPETDTWGVGIMAMTDKTADGILTANFVSITTAYHKGLDEDGLHQLGVGFQGTFGGRRLDGTRLDFEDELDLQGTWTNHTDEPINNQQINVNYFDLSAGILYNGSTDGYNNFYAGVSVYHINRPRESFSGDAGLYVLNPRITANIGGSFPVGTDKNLHLTAMMSTQAKALNIVAGGVLAFNVNGDENNPTNVYLGAFTRFSNLNDAIIPHVGLEFGSFRLGASYDVNISSLKVGSQRQGGIELALIYTLFPPDGRPKIPCPIY